MNGEEEEKEERPRKDARRTMGWLAMKTKATEAFARLEFKRAARWFGKALENLQIRRRKDERRNEGGKKKRSSVADGESIAGFVESEREENRALGNRSRCAKKKTRFGTKAVIGKRKLCML